MGKIIKSDKLRYFIFDTGNGYEKDKDFIQYNWSRKRYNIVREGDYFIYRRPTKVSENKKFYFFGVGRVGEIIDYENDVICKVVDPIRFHNIVFQDDIIDYEWKWNGKGKRKNFQRFFSNYGMNEIPFEDFEYLFKMGFGNIDVKIDKKENDELVKSHIKLLNTKNKSIGNEYLTKSRGSLGKIFSDNVKLIYDNKCCVSGISTRSLLHSSHISPWNTDKGNRGDHRNGLLLNLTLHKCFDEGLISFNNDYKLIISKNITDSELLKYLKPYQGKKIKLPFKKEYYPDKNLLSLHRKEWGFK